MAWLSRGQQHISIARIKFDQGTVVVNPLAINARFVSYYSALYSSRVTYSTEELGIYLDQITFPTLPVSARDRLDSPITLKEVQQALGALQAGRPQQ